MTTDDTMTTAVITDPNLAYIDWCGLALGMGPTRENGLQPVTLDPECSALVLGPPRIGKTSTMIVPNVINAPGAVVTTSTKREVMNATLSWRSAIGTCYVFDPASDVPVPAGAEELRWSPIIGCEDYDVADSMAHALVSSARPGTLSADAKHWVDQSRALLAPLLHAAALAGRSMEDLIEWVLIRDVRDPQQILIAANAKLAKMTLLSVMRAEERERSGIFSTSSTLLSAFRSAATLKAAADPNFDAEHFAASYDTVYITAPTEAQDQLAPLIVAIVDEIRRAVYRRRSRSPDAAPIVFALDEVAHIAPLPYLPALAAEGAGQGLLTLACMQDLSQARHIWGDQAEGFMSLFGATVAFPGIKDRRTLELISALAGEVQAPMVSHSQPDFFAAVLGKGFSSTTTSFTWRPRLPVDAIANAPKGTALLLAQNRPPTWIRTIPCEKIDIWSNRVDQSRSN